MMGWANEQALCNIATKKFVLYVLKIVGVEIALLPSRKPGLDELPGTTCGLERTLGRRLPEGQLRNKTHAHVGYFIKGKRWLVNQ